MNNLVKRLAISCLLSCAICLFSGCNTSPRTEAETASAKEGQAAHECHSDGKCPMAKNSARPHEASKSKEKGCASGGACCMEGNGEKSDHSGHGE